MPSRAGPGLPRMVSAAIAVLVLCAAMPAQDGIDPEKYAKVKAGLVLNFLRYTEWPADRFEDDRDPLIVTVLGRDAMLPELRDLVDGERVRGRAIELRRLDHPTSDPRTGRIDPTRLERFHALLRESHLLFIASTERAWYLRVLHELDDEDILTVSDIDDFAVDGGMLGLVVRRGRVTIDANIEELEDTDLQVSSKLLRLARIVRTRDRRR